MNVLYEESGAFKSGTVLADNDSSLQVEAPHGKRSKIKSAAVLLRFERPAPAELTQAAEAYAAAVDTEFLWECSGAAEFGFEQLAEEYCGRAPTPVEAAGILFKLHAAPMYFYRKGRGRYRAAPAETLKAALAGQEKKRRLQMQIDAWAAELQAGSFPDALRAALPELLYKPDRNTAEVKALEKACEASGLSAARLLERAGGITSTHDFHLQRFLFECFPRGTGFGALDAHARLVEMPELPAAGVQAFSIDDAATTEIDDAFSVTPLSPGRLRIGIHIAAPSLGFAPGSPLDRAARERLSTVYMPGHKITMLPDEVIERFSLAAGRSSPALSLYVDVREEDWSIENTHTALERVEVAANLRHQELESLDEAFLSGTVPEGPFMRELYQLWGFALALEGARGKPSVGQDRADYNFYVERDAEGGERIVIAERPRGTPLDKLVAEMMIFANSTWGKLLDENGIPGVYRVQSNGKVRMTTTAAPHQGLGISHYAWATSPLRRYVDLVNQWQLGALLRGGEAPFKRDDELHAVVHEFEATYAVYADFQSRMERYWSLRWLLQEGIGVAGAQVVRDNLLRLHRVPLYLRIPGLPALPAGAEVQLEVGEIDLLEAEIRCTCRPANT
jgi:exoribonuclease-2